MSWILYLSILLSTSYLCIYSGLTCGQSVFFLLYEDTAVLVVPVPAFIEENVPGMMFSSSIEHCGQVYFLLCISGYLLFNLYHTGRGNHVIKDPSPAPRSCVVRGILKKHHDPRPLSITIRRTRDNTTYSTLS